MRQRIVLASSKDSGRVRSLYCHSSRGHRSNRSLPSPSARWAVSEQALAMCPRCLCLGTQRRAGDNEAERRGIC